MATVVDTVQENLTTPTEATPAINASAEVVAEHPLESKWVLWVYTHRRGEEQWRQSYSPVHTCATVEDFWRLHRYIGHNPFSAISGTGDVSFFKKGVEPAWEDPTFARGGRWILRFPKRTLVREFWLNLSLSAIGEQFPKEIEGLGCSLRAKYIKVSVWMRHADEDIINHIGLMLCRMARDCELETKQAYVQQAALVAAAQQQTGDEEDGDDATPPPGLPPGLSGGIQSAPVVSGARFGISECAFEDFEKKSLTKLVNYELDDDAFWYIEDSIANAKEEAGKVGSLPAKTEGKVAGANLLAMLKKTSTKEESSKEKAVGGKQQPQPKKDASLKKKTAAAEGKEEKKPKQPKETKQLVEKKEGDLEDVSSKKPASPKKAKKAKQTSTVAGETSGDATPVVTDTTPLPLETPVPVVTAATPMVTEGTAGETTSA